MQVNFIGEPAVDAGGPSREFFQLFLQELDKRLLIPCYNGSKIFDHNVQSLQVNPTIIECHGVMYMRSMI